MQAKQLYINYPSNLMPANPDRYILDSVWKSADDRLTNHRFQHFTDHTIEHSYRIMSYASQLLAVNNIELNDGERFVLLCAIALHDIGMTTDTYLEDEDRNRSTELKLEAIRAMHHEYTYLYIKNNRSKLGLSERK